MANRAKIEKIYPNLFDKDLPLCLECPKNEENSEAKKTFERICPRDAVIIFVDSWDAYCEPACVWQVHYIMKSDKYDYIEDGIKKKIPPPDLPDDRDLYFPDFYKKLTNKACYLDLDVRSTYASINTIIVEYCPKSCECGVRDFYWTPEEPPMSSIAETETNMEKLKIHS